MTPSNTKLVGGSDDDKGDDDGDDDKLSSSRWRRAKGGVDVERGVEWRGGVEERGGVDWNALVADGGGVAVPDEAEDWRFSSSSSGPAPSPKNLGSNQSDFLDKVLKVQFKKDTFPFWFSNLQSLAQEKCGS